MKQVIVILMSLLAFGSVAMAKNSELKPPVDVTETVTMEGYRDYEHVRYLTVLKEKNIRTLIHNLSQLLSQDNWVNSDAHSIKNIDITETVHVVPLNDWLVSSTKLMHYRVKYKDKTHTELMKTNPEYAKTYQDVIDSYNHTVAKFAKADKTAKKVKKAVHGKDGLAAKLLKEKAKRTQTLNEMKSIFYKYKKERRAMNRNFDMSWAYSNARRDLDETLTKLTDERSSYCFGEKDTLSNWTAMDFNDELEKAKTKAEKQEIRKRMAIELVKSCKEQQKIFDTEVTEKIGAYIAAFVAYKDSLDNQYYKTPKDKVLKTLKLVKGVKFRSDINLAKSTEEKLRKADEKLDVPQKYFKAMDIIHQYFVDLDNYIKEIYWDKRNKKNMDLLDQFVSQHGSSE